MATLAHPQSAPIDHDGGEQIWIRIPSAVHRFGLSKPKLYALAKAGRIRSISCREPGQVRGTRLFYAQSILDYIESFETTSTA